MECRVEFDYVAQEPDELTIKKGDIIKNVTTKMDGWYEGTLKGKTGVFPDNFVKIMEKPAPVPEQKPSEVVVLRNNPTSSRRVKVLFSYAPEQDDELPLDVGDILEFIEEVEEGWWRGKLKGTVGIFPSNFVEEIDEPKTNGGFESHSHSKMPEEPKLKETTRHSLTKGIPVPPDVVPATPPPAVSQSIDDEPAPELPPKPVRELARCFYPYTALNEDELTLAEGDIVTIISKSCEDEGWWRGELRGKIGLFPDNFVKIITPGEAQSGHVSTGPHQKMLAQERNVPPSSDFLANKAKKDSVGERPTSTTSVVDGGGMSKTPESKIEQTKAKLSKTNSKDLQPQVPIITPKVGHAATSPISPGIAAFHTNLFSNTQKPPDAFAKSKDPPPVPREEKASDESEEFNSVERTETLNHLTATRAKAPKRRPPSAIITRENEGSMLNGSSNSYDASLPDSPPNHFSTPMNGTMSGSFTDGGSSLNHSGSFHSNNSRGGDTKEGSPTPSSANTSTGSAVSANKPKKQTLPWMAELKQTQDKKRNLVSPVGPPVTTGSPAQPTTSPSVTSTASTAAANSSATGGGTTPTHPAVKNEPAKAPPLPAKPSMLSSNNSPSTLHDKPANNLNHATPPPGNNASSATPPFKPFVAKKSSSPSPVVSNNHNHHGTTTNSPMISTTVMDNSGHVLHRVDGENSNSTSNKSYVTFEEHQALKTRVTSLENEVETLKRQLKVLIDRDFRGHIV